MKPFYRPHRQVVAHSLVVATLVFYSIIFLNFHDQIGVGIASLATIPVIIAGWYFGIGGGTLIAVLSVFINITIQSLTSHPVSILLSDPGNVIRIFILSLIAVVTGRLSTLTAERQKAIHQLENYENEHRAHVDFLELLNVITVNTLESDSLQTTLEILTERIARLFGADDGYFSLWDANKDIPVPLVAYGSMRDVYPYIIIEPGQLSLAHSVLEAEHPIAVADIENSVYINSQIAAIFPNHSMLGLPFIAQGRKLGALVLGYSAPHTCSDNDIVRATMTAEQVTQVLSKSLLLEEERKQVKQLTALHDVAVTSIETDNEDQLIERVTEIIGQNLFPDNFGILLLNESDQSLHAHPSYRFYGADELQIGEVPAGQGISGEVAATGQPQRIGDVRLNHQYVDMDDRTLSELCVPIKFKDRILGVINAESMKRNAFTADDERLLVTLAGQLATALEQMRRSQAERKWLDQLAHSNDLIYSIAQITTQIEKALTMEDIIQTLGEELHSLGLTCIMTVYDKNRNSFTVNYTSLGQFQLKIIETGLGYPLLDYAFSRRQLEQTSNGSDLLRPLALTQPEKEIEALFIGAEHPGVLRILRAIGVTPEIEPLRVPLVFEDNLLGMLWIWGSEIRKSDLPIISLFAKQVAVSLERARLFQEVQSLALTDPLTDLHNRRSIFEVGRVEFARAHRMNRPFCCMMLDLDHFKKINDAHGHQAGDRVLQEFARRCKRSVREMDIVGRYGGEELIIIMPETDLKTAIPIAERLRRCVAEIPMNVPGQEVWATVSIGVAEKDLDVPNLETLIARADQAMYTAKHNGRNQVFTSQPLAVS